MPEPVPAGPPRLSALGSRLWGAVALLLALAPSPGPAGESLWADRGDRFEGVIATQSVSGGTFRLVGVHRPGPQGSEGSLGEAKRLALSYWLPSPTPSLRIKVWEPETNYWMVPHRREYGSGEQRFSWPSGEVLRPLGVRPARLRALVSTDDEGLYFPARLSAEGDAAGGDGCWFLFESRAGVEVEASLWAAEGRGPLWRRRVVEDFPGTVRLAWDGRGEGGAPVPAGVLQLRLRGILYLPQGDEPLALALRFHHRGAGAVSP